MTCNSIYNRTLLGASLLAAAIAPAHAGFLLINEGAYTLPSDPLTIISERDENQRLQQALIESQRSEAKLGNVVQALSQETARQQTQLVAQQQEISGLESKIKAQLDAITAAMPKKVVVNFAFGSVTFRPNAQAQDKISLGAKYADRVVVNGYTDSVGSLAANAAIAFKRALSAKQYLMAEGVSDIKIKIYGRTAPHIASNKTAAGRAANRRVEINFHRDERTKEQIAAMVAMLNLPEETMSATGADSIQKVIHASDAANSAQLAKSSNRVNLEQGIPSAAELERAFSKSEAVDLDSFTKEAPKVGMAM